MFGVFLSGVSDGDSVVLTPPNSMMQAPGIERLTAWVSAPNMIQIRACNLDPGTTQNQKTSVSGIVRIDVWKH